MLEQVRERDGFERGEIDTSFGVIAIDPGEDLYRIMVEEAAALQAVGEAGREGASLEGPYANPPIQPFGPPEASRSSGPAEKLPSSEPAPTDGFSVATQYMA